MTKKSVKEAPRNFSHILSQVEQATKTLKKLPSLKKFRESIEIKGMPLSMLINKAREEND